MGCVSGGSEPYTQNEGPTSQLGDNLVTYGAPVAAGAGVGYLGAKATGNTLEGGAIGLAAGGAVLGLEHFDDAKSKKAYTVGVQNGQAEARAEIANEVYRREAIYGVPPPPQYNGTGSANPTPIIREVYVPSRTINGVTYPATVQKVAVYQ